MSLATLHQSNRLYHQLSFSNQANQVKIYYEREGAIITIGLTIVQAPLRGLPEFDLSGKVYVGTTLHHSQINQIVTGGARGLGLVQVGALIEAGAAAVFAFDRLPTPEPHFTDLQKKYPSQHLEYKQVDVTKPDTLKQTFKQVADSKGRLDGLVAAAGIQYEAPALEYTADDCRRILDVNVLFPIIPIVMYCFCYTLLWSVESLGYWCVSLCTSCC